MDTFIHYGMAAGIHAIKDAGLEANPVDAERIGVAIGSGIGGLPMIENDARTNYIAERCAQDFPLLRSRLDHQHDLRQPVHPVWLQGSQYRRGELPAPPAPTNIGEAARLIEYGDADVMIAGGAESTVTPLGMGGFCAARALSTRNDDPEDCQPAVGQGSGRLRAGRRRRRCHGAGRV